MVVRALHSWLQASRDRALVTQWPFLETWELAEAHERGEAVARAVAARWRRLRESAARTPDARAMPIGDGRFRVRFADGRLRELNGAAEAVAVIIAGLPDDAVPRT